MYTLRVLLPGNEKPFVLKRAEGGSSLLELCLRHGIEIPHRCGGICHCTTCHIYVEKGERFIHPKEKREADFLVKVAGNKPHSRLACQSLLIDGSGEITLRLPAADSTQNP